MKQHFQEARANLRNGLSKAGETHHMFYGPTSDLYWEQDLKIIAVNMEPYGYQDCGLFQVKRDDLIDWIYDAGGTGTKTTRYTLAIMALIRRCVHDKLTPSKQLLSESYHDSSLIEETLDRTVYYNIRPQSNHQKPQDYSAISSVGESSIGKLVWSEITSLSPDIILVGGQAGLEAVNELIGSEHSLTFRGYAEVDGILIHSIPHPSRPAYEDWCEASKNCLNWLKQK